MAVEEGGHDDLGVGGRHRYCHAGADPKAGGQQRRDEHDQQAEGVTGSELPTRLFVRLMQFGQHRRRPLAKLFFADASFTQPLPVDQPPFAAFGRCYEVCQWSPSSYNGQTTRAAAVTEGTGDQKRLVRMDFAAATESRYYAPVALGIWCADWETGCQALGISGHFAVLTPQERGLPHAPELPRYDVSWILDRPMPA